MKTIVIERVHNGWIARPFNPSPSYQTWASTEAPMIWVFTKMEDLQSNLPQIFSTPDFHETPATVLCNPLDCCK